VPGPRLHDELRGREQRGVQPGPRRRQHDVVLAGKDQGRRLEPSEGGSDGRDVGRSGGVVVVGRVGVLFLGLTCVVGPGDRIPTAVGERCDVVPVRVGGLAGPDAFERGIGSGEPRLAATEVGDLATVGIGDVEPYGSWARVISRSRLTRSGYRAA
jgi:hypothetical protein